MTAPGQLVYTYADTGAMGASLVVGVIESVGPKVVIVRWRTGHVAHLHPLSVGNAYPFVRPDDMDWAQEEIDKMIGQHPESKAADNAHAAKYAGVVWTRHFDGRRVTVYDGRAADLDTEGGRYTVTCEKHSACVTVGSRRGAIEHARGGSQNWCDACREEDEADEKGAAAE